MKVQLVAVAATAVLLAACAKGNTPAMSGSTALVPATANGPVGMTLSFNPSPPKEGNETLTIALKAADGSAVTGASVRIATTMPAMSMSGPSLTAQDNGDGTYSAVIDLNYATKWKFDVLAESGGQKSEASFSSDIP